MVKSQSPDTGPIHLTVRSGQVLDSSGDVERSIPFNEADRKL